MIIDGPVGSRVALVQGPFTSSNTSAVRSKLRRLAALSEASEQLLAELPLLEEYGGGQNIRNVVNASRGFFLKSGWAARYRLLSDGRRQIVSLLLPGDHAGFHGDQSAEAALPLITITRVVLLSGAPLRAPLALGRPEHAGLLVAMSRADLLTRTQLINQIVRLGRQTGVERMAHLLAELESRLCAVDMAEDGVFRMPLTQDCLADTLGLSIVHVNRTLKYLKRERVLELSGGQVRILKPTLLEALADYQPAIHADAHDGAA